MYPIVLSQNKFRHRDDVTYPFEERGLQFGDGVYEVIRLYNGKPFLLTEHIERLFRSLQAISINLSYSKEVLIESLLRLIEHNSMQADGFIYLQITRGSAPRMHEFPADVPANFYAYIKEFASDPSILQQGVTAITLPDERWLHCHIKSLNLLPNVLAKQTATEKGAFEPILHRNGTVTECASSNVFLVKNNIIYTHPANNLILNGCVRSLVLDLCKQNKISIIEKAFSVENIPYADEIFLTNSVDEIVPVVKVNEAFIADGKRGAITKLLQEAYTLKVQISSQKLNVQSN